MRVTKQSDGSYNVEDQPMRVEGEAAERFMQAMEARESTPERQQFQAECRAVYESTQSKISVKNSRPAGWMDGDVIAGYLTTSMNTVELVRPHQREKHGVLDFRVLPGGQVLKIFPALLIGMLAVCDKEQYRRKGLGRHMVKYAIGQAEKLSETIGCRFVTVDAAYTEAAFALYDSLGFESVEQRGERDRATMWMFYDLGPHPGVESLAKAGATESVPTKQAG